MNPFPTLALLAALPAALLAQSPIESTFRGGLVISNPAPAAATMYFDIDVISPTGIIVDRFDINTNAPTGTTGTFAVYVTAVGGTANGFQTNAAAWTLVNTQQVTAAGARTQVLLTNPIPLAFGRYGIAMHHVSLNPVYTNPNTAPVLPLTFTNADLTLDFTYGRSRTSLTTDAFGGTAAGNSPRMANVAVHYTTASVSADFTATPTRGASPLTVQFRSRAASSNPGGITAYVWDFDGDGVPDGSGANPTWIYTNCGNYTVSMTVIDSVAPTQVTKTNYIQTDIVVPSFSYALVAPNTLQFTDTSVPTPTTWDWDLDGDGITDSTLQNPVFAYTTQPPFGEVNVRLTAGRACQPTATTQRYIAISNALQTAFGGGLIIAATSTGGANFVDVNVTNPQGISVSSMHINSSVPVGSPVTVDVYVAQGGYTGKQTDINQWRQLANVVATSRGTNGRTFVQFQPSLYLPAGTHGLCVRQTGASPVYSNLGQVVTVTNSDLSVTGGLTMAEPVFATGTQYNPRMWNGVINYSTCSLTSDAGYGFFAAGCTGASGVPGNGASSLPRLGNAMNVTFTNLPVNAAIVALGFSRTASAFGPLPLDLTAFGAPGCFGNVSPDATNLIVGTSGRANWTLTIPASASLLCTQFYSQAFVADPAANLLGFITSDAAAAIIGQ